MQKGRSKKKREKKDSSERAAYKYLNGKKLILVRCILVASISGKTQKRSKKHITVLI